LGIYVENIGLEFSGSVLTRDGELAWDHCVHCFLGASCGDCFVFEADGDDDCGDAEDVWFEVLIGSGAGIDDVVAACVVTAF
jgi:hypothetical protein